MEEEILNGIEEETLNDNSPVSSASVMIAVNDGNGGKYLLTKEQYEADKSLYNLVGIALVDSSSNTHLLASVEAKNAVFGNGGDTLSDDDESVKDVTNPSSYGLNGKLMTELNIRFAEEGEYDSPDCAIGYCKSYGDGSWWLGSIGEVELIYSNIDEINSLFDEPIYDADAIYWTSDKWSDDYNWSVDFSDNKMRYWKSRKEQHMVIPINSCSEYEILENE